MKNKWIGLLGLAALAFLAGSNGDGCQPAPGQGEACGQGDSCATGLTCIHYSGVAGPAGAEFRSCEYPCNHSSDCPSGQQCVLIADGPGNVCRPVDGASSTACDPYEERSCGDDEVCVVEDGQTSGTCMPFQHGQSVGAGYSCGGSIGVSCADGLYCKGLPHGHVLGGTGVCTNMTCQDWREEYESWVSSINHCTTAADCEAVPGTSCGCTRNVVVNKNEDVDAFKAFVGQMSDAGCAPTSSCDCPPANGYACTNGVCGWNYL